MTTVAPIPLGMVKAFLLQGDSNTVLVDAGFRAAQASKILTAVRATRRPLSLIVITHVHIDHVAALSALVKATGAPVAVHAVEADLLRRGQSQVVRPTSQVLKSLLRPSHATFEAVEPNVIVQDQLDLTPFGVAGQVISTPGHTDGSLSIRLSSGEVIVGDMIMSVLMSTRIPTWPIIAQNPPQVAESIRRVLDWQPTLIYAAHGGPFTAQDVAQKLGRQINGYLSTK